jgi:drug/metabolite transporter (DMT)-like permease
MRLTPSVVLVLVVWVTSVGLCDIASADFLSRRSVAELVFFTNFFGSLGGASAVLLTRAMQHYAGTSCNADPSHANKPGVSQLTMMFLMSLVLRQPTQFATTRRSSYPDGEAAAAVLGGISRGPPYSVTHSSSISPHLEEEQEADLAVESFTTNKGLTPPPESGDHPKKDVEALTDFSGRDRWLCGRQRSLFIVLSLTNTAGMLFMFESFQWSGMSSVYALKACEPMFTCWLATGVAQRLLLEPLAGCDRRDGSRRRKISFGVQPNWRVWTAVMSVSAVSALAASTVSRPQPSQDAPLLEGRGKVVCGISFVLLSNFLFSLRTTVQKPLLKLILDTHRDRVAPAAASSLVFVNVGVAGSVLMAGPVIMFYFSTPPASAPSAVDLAQLLFIGFTYCAYHTCNGIIIQHISSVTYSVAKQVRIVLTFVASIVVLGQRVPSWGALGGSCGLLILATHWFAREERRCAAVDGCSEHLL